MTFSDGPRLPGRDGVLFPLFHSSSQWAQLRDTAMERNWRRDDLLARQEADHYNAYRTPRRSVNVVQLYQVAILYGARKSCAGPPTRRGFFING